MFNIYNIQRPPANQDKLPKDLNRDIIKKQFIEEKSQIGCSRTKILKLTNDSEMQI